jgi:RluA family pseudouridine synthase
VSGEREALGFLTGPADAGARLDEGLARRLSAASGRRVSKSQARKWIVVGAVRVAGRVVRQPGRPLGEGVRVELVLRRGARIGPPADRPFELTARDVLFEDEFVIAVNKPAGLPTQPTVDPDRPSLVASIKRYLARGRGERAAGEAYLGIHQRLDRDTSGVVLFAKDPSANKGLAAQFEGRAVEKVYLAWVRPARGLRTDRWRESGRLGPAAGKPPRMRVVREGGQAAVTDFEVRRRLAHAWLLEARPRTGRKHQIRVHLAAAGQPILGDVLYGGASRLSGERLPRPLLHAASLELKHPVTGAPMKIESPLPQDFARVMRAAS